MSTQKWLISYYGGTALFVVLDLFLSLNVRAAFLEPWPAARAGYYVFLFACFALMFWRPAWATAVGTSESLASLVALILGMSVRVMVPTDAIMEGNVEIVTAQEIVNFVIVGSVAYFAWIQGAKSLRKNLRS